MNPSDNGLLIKQIHDSLEKSANNQLREKDLTMMQVSVLQALQRAENHEMTMKEIERHFQIAQSTVAGIISRLEKKEYVKTYGSEEDRRIKIVSITEKGVLCSKEAEKNMLDTETLISKGFTREEKTLLTSLLQRVLNNVK